MTFVMLFDTKSYAEWITPNGTNIPANAVIAGENEGGETLFVCRAPVNGGALPGKLIGSSGKCIISFGGTVYSASKYDVLVGSDYNWVAQFDGEVPFDAVPAGKGKSGEALFSCRGEINSRRYPGRIQRDSKGCYVPFKGKETKAHWYEVLTVVE